jgi:hypothetical protein
VAKAAFKAAAAFSLVERAVADVERRLAAASARGTPSPREQQ